jgi:hypothetical protein
LVYPASATKSKPDSRLLFVGDGVEFPLDAGDLGFDVPFAGLVVLAQPHEPGSFVPLGQGGLRFRPREFVPQFRQFDLELCLARVRPLAEDLQDEGKPVDDLRILGELSRDVVRLVGAEPVVDDHGARAGFGDHRGELLHLPLPEVEGGVLGAGLGHARGDLVARTVC